MLTTLYDFLFKKKKKKKITKHFSSNLGRAITSVDTAKSELYHEPHKYNPKKNIGDDEKEFFGMYRNDEDNYEGMYIPKFAINHRLYCGYTRSGKGIIIGNKIIEVLQDEKKGMIYIDVKQEDFTPQIILEELQRQDREDDLLIVNYPHDFGYSGFNKDDTVIQIWEKISVALDLEKSNDPAVEHYKSNQRMTLLKILNVIYNGEDNPRDWYFLMEYIRCLSEDLKNYKQLQEELQKQKHNQNRIDKLSEMYFTIELIEKLEFNAKNTAALEIIYIKIFELLLEGNIHSLHTVKEALYNGKILYIKGDMENSSSLQMIKILFTDISQVVRKEKGKGRIANCEVFADEVSFYATRKLAGMLSTMAGFGVKFSLLLQDISQLEDDFIKNSILSNCTVKLFYKISDETTLNYVKLLGGEEIVTKYSKRNLEDTFAQELEPLLNTTRIRAMWFQQHAILIAEYLNTAYFVETDFVKVKKVFDWSTIDDAQKREPFKREKKKINIYKNEQAGDVDITNIDEEIINILANHDDNSISDF